jgi:3-oxoacyl-[acyl-carrier-protein] synthase-3
MRYENVTLPAIAYELPSVVVQTAELEQRLAPMMERLKLPAGQIETLTGIRERRWWEPGFGVSRGAIAAGRRAMADCGLTGNEIDVVIYAGVCRELYEPATACQVADALNVHSGAAVHDISNACLGVLNGMVDVANRIELGQARAGLVVSCESARDVIMGTIDKLNANPSMDLFVQSLATLTGGSGAVAVLLVDRKIFPTLGGPRLLGGALQTAPQFHHLCRWGIEKLQGIGLAEFMTTDAVGVLKHGVDLGLRTWQNFLERLGWKREMVDKVICHQVGTKHRETIMTTLGLGMDRDFSSFPFLGNIGTVSLPLTAALAAERGFLRPGDLVGFLGIGSGLNCMMLGLEW